MRSTKNRGVLGNLQSLSAFELFPASFYNTLLFILALKCHFKNTHLIIQYYGDILKMVLKIGVSLQLIILCIPIGVKREAAFVLSLRYDRESIISHNRLCVSVCG